MKLYFRCDGKTNQCRLFCKQPVPECWKSRGKGKAKAGTVLPCCCGGSGDDEHWLLCKCQPGVHQPETHFHCRCAFRVVIRGPDFAKAEIHEGDENAVTHQSVVGESMQQRHWKIPESVKDDLDLSRIQDRTTPRQWLACTLFVVLSAGTRSASTCDVAARGSKTPVFASDLPDSKAPQGEPKPVSRAEQVARIATRQVQSRMRRVDERMRLVQAGCNEAPGSDWRLLELYLQNIHEDVLIFMRGDQNDKTFFKDGVAAPVVATANHCRAGGRPFLACVTHIELLKELRKHGSILGMDTKWDFLWFHLPTIVATFADSHARGQLAFLALASAEDPAVVELLIELLIHNVPCRDPHCKHVSQLHVFEDGSGWSASSLCVFAVLSQCVRAAGIVRASVR